MRVTAAMVLLAPAALVPVQGAARCPAPASEVAYGGAPARGWPDPEALALLATGAGVRVAVLDSGVDAAHPQLRGAVEPGRDLVRGEADARADCVGHGTAVASIIAARPVAGSVLRGLAPGATVVPVRVTEQVGNGQAGNGQAGEEAARFAEAIAWAADPAGGDADVLNLSVVTTVDDPAVRRAVAGAVEQGRVVVAAAGNAAGRGNPTPFPAAYPGVIGVGAVTAEGVRAEFSQHGPYVDLVAPGAGVTAAAPGGGQRVVGGTSFAVPVVAAAAALVVQRFPGAGPDEVRRRLTATADPAPGGTGEEYGSGLLNPVRALREELGPAGVPGRTPLVFAVDEEAVAARERRVDARDRALLIAGVLVPALAVVWWKRRRVQQVLRGLISGM